MSARSRGERRLVATISCAALLGLLGPGGCGEDAQIGSSGYYSASAPAGAGTKADGEPGATCGDTDCSSASRGTLGDSNCTSGLCDASCGDGVCDTSEDCWSCDADCGTCKQSCGNRLCDGGEQCSTCPVDCGGCDEPAAVPTRGPYLQTGTPSGVTVRWRTEEATDSAVLVYEAMSDDVLFSVVNGNITTEHEVVLDTLQPDSDYLYRIGSTTSLSLGGDDYRFHTHPTPGTSTAPVRAWLLGDPGLAGAALDAVRDAYYDFSATKDTDVWILLGDNAYTSGTDDQYQAALFDVYPAYLRSHVVWPTIGNHERVDAGGAYFDIFTLPTAGESGGVPSGTEHWYSFDYGDVHFVCLDSDTSSESKMMMTWLDNDLAANERTWLIAYWHHPPYSKGAHNSDTIGQMISMRENAVPILESYGVDMVLSGHNHNYERSYLIHGHSGDSDSFDASMTIDGGDGRESGDGAYSRAMTDGPGSVYVVAGSSSRTRPMLADRHEAMFISLEELGSMVLDIDGGRLDATFLGEDGSTRDYFTIIKN